MRCAATVGIALLVASMSAEDAEAQTIGQRFTLDVGAGVSSTGYGPAMEWYFGGRAYWRERNVFAFLYLYDEPFSADVTAFGLGGVVSRSKSERLLFRGGFITAREDAYTYPFVGAGVEFGRTVGGFVTVDYVALTPSDLPALVTLKFGAYWGF